jgi:hypothetical protein
MAKRLALYLGVTGFHIVIVGETLQRLVPGTATLLGHLPQRLCPLEFADKTSAPCWSVMLGGVLQNGLLYAALGLVIGLAATGVSRKTSL